MEKAKYENRRFAKYKGPEIGNIEAHNDRKKKKYTSGPLPAKIDRKKVKKTE